MREPKMTAARNKPRSGRPVVMCVDDEAPVLAALSRVLRREPFDVVTANGPRKALQWMERHPVDLLLSDERMPELNGSQLIEIVRKRSPETTCLMLTAYPRTPSVVDQVRRGSVRLMTKPWVDEELRSTVRELLYRPGTLRKPVEPAPLLGGGPDFAESILRIDCRSETTPALMRKIEPVLRLPATLRGGLVLITEHLEDLRDSVIGFLQFLKDRLGVHSVPTTLLDRSGYAHSLQELLRGDAPLRIFGPEQTDGREARLLVVHSEQEPGKILSLVAESAGYDAELARSSNQARTMLQRTSYDAILLDLALPGGRALDIARLLLRNESTTSLIALTSWPTLWDERLFEGFGIRRCLMKPCLIYEILEALREVGTAAEEA